MNLTNSKIWGTEMNLSRAYLFIKLIRPHQWIKNIFCLAGVFFSMNYSTNEVLLSILGLVSFCLASSSVYVFNDIYDVKSDQLHPNKKSRPIASGQISVFSALFCCFLLIATAFIIASNISMLAMVILLLYFTMNILYSLKLKHVVIVDVYIISLGFILRLLMGTSAINIQPSRWIILCTMMVTLFLGFAKRKSELLAVLDGNITRKVLDDYSHLMLDIYLSIMAACTIMCYSIFVILGTNYNNLWITIPFVVFGIMRYLYIMLLKDGGQDTSKDIFNDYLISTSCVFFLVTYALVINYLH